MGSPVGTERHNLIEQTQTSQSLTNEGETMYALQVSGVVERSPSHEGASNRFSIRMAIRLVFAQDVPDGDEEFTGDGSNGFGFPDPFSQGLKLLTPIG